MPTDQRLRPDDLNNLQHRRKPAIQLDEEQTISVVKPNPSPALPLQDNQLLSERCDLGLEPRLGSEWRGQDGQNEPEKLDHPVNLRDSLSPSNGMRFSVHTGVAHRLARERIDHNRTAARLQGDADKNGNGETSGIHSCLKVTPALP
jgi:hypothetical protein